jgi:hypothetical protein
MGTDRTKITREIDSLIDQQIHTLNQDADISASELNAHRQRSQRIRMLCESQRRGKSPNWIHNKPAEDTKIKS